MKAPKFLSDLYADMRDRKLIPLVAVLLIAIPAVPILLSSDPEPIPPAVPIAAGAEADELPTLPAVLASDPGLRDYRERLNALRTKNPFAGVPAEKSKSKDAQVEDVTEAAEAAGIPVGTGGSGGGGTSIDESTTTESIDVTDNSVSNSGNNNNNNNNGNTEPDTLAFRVDVEVGRAGDLQRRKNVKLLTPLPSQSNPVSLFLGASEDGKHAVFLVSDDVVTARGDGRCVPTPADCQFANLKKGDEMRFGYAPNGGDADTYVLKVLDILLERNEDTANPDRSGRSDSGDPSGTLAASSGS